MRSSVVTSVLLHVGALSLAFVSLPESWRSKIVSEPVVPIDLISEAELAAKTSVPAMKKKATPPKPEAKPEPKPKAEPPKPKPEPLKPKEQKPAPKPEPKKPEPASVKPKESPKPKPKKPEADDLDLDALSELVDKAKKSAAPAELPDDAIEGDRDQERIGAGDRLAATDIDKMRAAIGRCWQTSALIGAPNPEKLVVELEIRLNRDGTLIGPPRTMNAIQINLSGNQFWKAAEQIALRAVVSCQPYDFLAPDRYEAWKEMELNFDPSLMAGI
jgi:hypothetical protein